MIGNSSYFPWLIRPLVTARAARVMRVQRSRKKFRQSGPINDGSGARSIRLAESGACLCGRKADEARVEHGGLAVLHRFAIDRIADHLDEGRNRRILGDEAFVPGLVA